ERLRLAAGAVVDGDVIAGIQQALGQLVSHTSGADPSNSGLGGHVLLLLFRSAYQSTQSIADAILICSWGWRARFLGYSPGAAATTWNSKRRRGSVAKRTTSTVVLVGMW